MLKKMLMISLSSLTLLMGCSFVSNATEGTFKLQSVQSVDLNKYKGKWYEIASFPNSFQKDCVCTTAEYTPAEDGNIKVNNTCRILNNSGRISQAEGKAFIQPDTNNSKLKVQFFWPFQGDYWVIQLDRNYNYAVISEPERKYLWILSRTKTMDEVNYQNIIKTLKEQGFNLNNLNKTEQSCS